MTWTRTWLSYAAGAWLVCQLSMAISAPLILFYCMESPGASEAASHQCPMHHESGAACPMHRSSAAEAHHSSSCCVVGSPCQQPDALLTLSSEAALPPSRVVSIAAPSASGWVTVSSESLVALAERPESPPPRS